MKLLILILTIFTVTPGSQKCPDCQEYGCIYLEINNAVKGGKTDEHIEQAIQSVCKERNITDSKTIDLLRANYYL